jgi:y4mF family transcriptional regulator
MKIIDSKSLGATIRERRKELHYTQAFLADFTGLSATFISDVERGKTTAEIGKVIQLLNTLGLDILIEKRG